MSLLSRKAATFACTSLAVLTIACALAGCVGRDNVTQTSTRSEAGVSYETAIKVGSIGEQLDVINATACGDGGFFRKTHVEVVRIDDRHYDIVDVACTSGSSYRKFYFDVSSCFPCPD